MTKTITARLTYNDTGRRRWKRMQKRARPDIHHVNSTMHQSGQAAWRMQKWARLNIRYLAAMTVSVRYQAVGESYAWIMAQT